MARFLFIGSGSVAALVLVAGCVAGPVGAVLTGLSLFGVVGGGASAPGAAPRLTVDPNRQMSEMLQQSNASVDPRCEATLEAERAKLSPAEEVLKGGECRHTPVCLPGVPSPMMMTVCAPVSSATMTTAEAGAPEPPTTVSPADGAWSWMADE